MNTCVYGGRREEGRGNDGFKEEERGEWQGIYYYGIWSYEHVQSKDTMFMYSNSNTVTNIGHIIIQSFLWRGST